MEQGSIYTKHRRHVRAGNTRVSETSRRRKDWKVELSSQTIAIQRQSHYFESLVKWMICVSELFSLWREATFFLFVFCSPRQSWYFSLSSGMPPLWLAPSTSLGYVIFILTPLGLRGSQPVGQPSGSPSALPGISDPTGLYFGPSVRQCKALVMLLRGETPAALSPARCFLLSRRVLAGSWERLPQERAVEPAHAPRPPPAGNVLVPSGVSWATKRVRTGGTADLIHVLETVYGNIQEMLCTFNNENRFWAN